MTSEYADRLRDLYPLTEEKLNWFNSPTVFSPAPGIVTIIADYSNDTIDLTTQHVRELHKVLGDYLKWVSEKEVANG